MGMAAQVNWTLGDANVLSPDNKVRLPLASFNHIAREVLSLERSKAFYVDILGFDVGPRPPFDSDGYWLYGYGLSLHLVLTTQPESRKLLKRDRIKYFITCLPKVDHIAFITSDISVIRRTLDERNVYYKHDCPMGTGIEQIFFFDPDGNVIEVSNCARSEQQCADGAGSVALEMTGRIGLGLGLHNSSLSPTERSGANSKTTSPPHYDGIPMRMQQEPQAIIRSPSQVYINGNDIIVSPVHHVPSDNHSSEPNTSLCPSYDSLTANLPPEIQNAINAALAAASSPSTLLQCSLRSANEQGYAGDEQGIFDESFVFADCGDSVVVQQQYADGAQYHDDDPDPDNLLLLESLGVKSGSSYISTPSILASPRECGDR